MNEVEIRKCFDHLLAHEWVDMNHQVPESLRDALTDAAMGIEFLISSLNQEQAGQRLLDNLNLVRSGDKGKVFFEHVVYPELDHFEYLLKNDSFGHGGKRDGAGRPKKEKTVQTRVPESLLGLVLDLKHAYQDLNDFDKQTVRDSLQQVINEALIEGESSNQAYDERQTNI